MRSYLKRLNQRFRAWQTRRNSSYGTDISTPEARREARRHANRVDHAWLRRIWRNTHPLGAHAWRSNQPSPERIAEFADMGVRTILNLRGPSAFAVYLFEQEACAAHGITLIDFEIEAYSLDEPARYLALLDLFERAEKPLVMHCKSGADRSGLAAAFYLIDQEGVPPREAMGQLALKYAHRKRSRAGILDALLAAYARDHERQPIGLRDWLATRYDRDAITAAFEEARR